MLVIDGPGVNMLPAESTTVATSVELLNKPATSKLPAVFDDRDGEHTVPPPFVTLLDRSDGDATGQNPVMIIAIPAPPAPPAPEL